MKGRRRRRDDRPAPAAPPAARSYDSDLPEAPHSERINGRRPVDSSAEGQRRDGPSVPSSPAPTSAAANAHGPEVGAAHARHADCVAADPPTATGNDSSDQARASDSSPTAATTPTPLAPAWNMVAAPYWTPPGAVFDRWPRELRAAIVDVVNPVYFELVLRAEPGLAQSTGLTIVHLMWLEILEHLKAANHAEPTDIMDRITSESRDAVIARHLQVVQSKLKASEFLLRLQELRKQSTASISKADAAPPSPALPAPNVGALTGHIY